MSNILNSMPGISATRFMWKDADNNDYCMTDMSFFYLQNVLKNLMSWEYEKMTDKEKKFYENKMDELNISISKLNKLIKDKNLTGKQAGEATLSSFNMQLSMSSK